MYEQIKWFRSIMDSNRTILRDCERGSKIITSIHISDYNKEKKSLIACLGVTREDCYSNKENLCSLYLDIAFDEFNYLLLYITYGYINSYVVKFKYRLPYGTSSLPTHSNISNSLNDDDTLKGFGVVVIQR